MTPGKPRGQRLRSVAAIPASDTAALTSRSAGASPILAMSVAREVQAVDGLLVMLDPRHKDRGREGWQSIGAVKAASACERKPVPYSGHAR